MCSRIYIRGICESVTNYNLRDLCSKYGKTEQIHVYPGSGAFVTFEHEKAASAAAKILNGSVFMGCTLFVKLSPKITPAMKGGSKGRVCAKSDKVTVTPGQHDFSTVVDRMEAGMFHRVEKLLKQNEAVVEKLKGMGVPVLSDCSETDSSDSNEFSEDESDKSADNCEKSISLSLPLSPQIFTSAASTKHNEDKKSQKQNYLQDLSPKYIKLLNTNSYLMLNLKQCDAKEGVLQPSQDEGLPRTLENVALPPLPKPAKNLKKKVANYPFKPCLECKSAGKDIRFFHSSALSRHYKEVHDEEKFDCKLCHKKFARKDAFDRHFKICNRRNELLRE